ncbi:hypothetical protein [Sphingobacterium deserti]|uniref:Transposase (putative) YhgA-like domain-containing protein n=1 Tax=Sphingobacterium deserti TaxID=1229276 RepID=A0A0B8T3Y2_9SPHI|nr:hypothetical protein [Sphingobacterium deserti]KGE15986.1 hypothetical protein DI53_0101 [Sphingobacterium deserti]
MSSTKRSGRRVDDPLWKSVIENTFAHFLTFMFPAAAQLFDLERGFEYLDKEFESLFPPEPNNRGIRYVDKLVKVYLLDGSEKYVLCHIEVQSSKGKGDLPARMFQYFYRITDKYKVPVTAIAILADNHHAYRPSVYVQEFMGTRLHYTFNSYKILDQDGTALRANKNPFAVVVLTALQAILQRDVSDEQLMTIKHDLYDEMVNREMDKLSRQGIYDFLSRYVSFQDTTLFTIFEQEIATKLGRSTTMGTREYLLDKATKEGRRQERAKAEAEKLADKQEFARKMLQNGFDIALISDIIGLSVSEIEKLKV